MRGALHLCTVRPGTRLGTARGRTENDSPSLPCARRTWICFRVTSERGAASEGPRREMASTDEKLQAARYGRVRVADTVFSGQDSEAGPERRSSCNVGGIGPAEAGHYESGSPAEVGPYASSAGRYSSLRGVRLQPDRQSAGSRRTRQETAMNRSQLLTGALALVVSATAACNRADTSREAREAAAEVRTVAARAGERLADSWLTAKVQAKFFADDDVKA